MKKYQLSEQILSTPLQITLDGNRLDSSMTIRDALKFEYSLPAHMDILRPSKYTIPSHKELLRITRPRKCGSNSFDFDLELGNETLLNTNYRFQNGDHTENALLVDIRLMKPNEAPKAEPISVAQLAFCPAVIFACAFRGGKFRYNTESRFAFGCCYKDPSAQYFVETLIESFSQNRLESDRLKYYTVHKSPDESLAIFSGPLIQIDPNFRKLTYMLDMMGKDTFTLINEHELPPVNQWQRHRPASELKRN